MNASNSDVIFQTLKSPISILSQVQTTNIYWIPTVCWALGWAISFTGTEIAPGGVGVVMVSPAEDEVKLQRER